MTHKYRHDKILKTNKIKSFFNKLRIFLVSLYQKWRDPNIQKIIAISSVLTLIILSINLVYFWKQHRLTQSLNQPICATKSLKVDKTSGRVDKTSGKAIVDPEDVFKFSIIIKNFGTYAAKDVSIKYATFQLKPSNGILSRSGDSFVPPTPPEEHHIVLLPQHEIDYFMVYRNRKFLDEHISGNERALEVEVTIQYRNELKDRTERFSCSYIIGKLLGQEPDLYEADLLQSKLESLPDSFFDKIKSFLP
jgi:hypothetical protein